MTVVNHILVPTDGSTDAAKSAEFAGVLARALNARISVLRVQTDDVLLSNAWGAGQFPAGAPYGSMSVDEIRNMLEQRIREKDLPDTIAAIGALSEEPEAVIVWGHPAEEICRFAAERSVDLIVMGSHGRTGIRRALLGSVSHAVANQAPCPVTLVR